MLPVERPQQPFSTGQWCSRVENDAGGFMRGGQPPAGFFFFSTWCALPSHSPFHRSQLFGRWYRSPPPVRLAQLLWRSLTMTVATRRVSSQTDISARRALDGRGPVRKTIVMRSCSHMLVCTLVLYVRRERGPSAVMATGLHHAVRINVSLRLAE